MFLTSSPSWIQTLMLIVTEMIGPNLFWSFIKNFKRDSLDVFRLLNNGILKTGNKDKADI